MFSIRERGCAVFLVEKDEPTRNKKYEKNRIKISVKEAGERLRS